MSNKGDISFITSFLLSVDGISGKLVAISSSKSASSEGSLPVVLKRFSDLKVYKSLAEQLAFLAVSGLFQDFALCLTSSIDDPGISFLVCYSFTSSSEASMIISFISRLTKFSCS